MGVRNFHMHCDPDTGSGPGTRATAAGWPTSSVGENIAAGYTTPSAVMSPVNGWMGDCGHCANVLNASSREIGLGYYFDSVDQGTTPGTGNVRQSGNGQCPATSSSNGPYRHYWTQDFSSRSGVYPLVIEREKYLVTAANVALYLYQPPGTGLQMKFSNDGETWSAPVAFSTGSSWALTAGDGVKSVYCGGHRFERHLPRLRPDLARRDRQRLRHDLRRQLRVRRRRPLGHPDRRRRLSRPRPTSSAGGWGGSRSGSGRARAGKSSRSVTTLRDVLGLQAPVAAVLHHGRCRSRSRPMPGQIAAMRMPSWRRSSIAASDMPTRPNFEAL